MLLLAKCEVHTALQRHYINMSYLITLKTGMVALHSQTYTGWKTIVRDKIFDFERHAWDSFCESHLDMRVAHSCLENVSPFCFWSLGNQFSDLVSRLHIQVRLMGNFGLNGSIPWLQNINGAICFICKEENESVLISYLTAPISETILTLFGMN